MPLALPTEEALTRGRYLSVVARLKLPGQAPVTDVRVRTREIGLRMALGARRGEVLRLVLKQGLLLSSIGIAIGLAGALAMTRVLSGLLFGVGTTDPATFTAIVPFLLIVSWIACYIPARRATRVDPLLALSYE